MGNGDRKSSMRMKGKLNQQRLKERQRCGGNHALGPEFEKAKPQPEKIADKKTGVSVSAVNDMIIESEKLSMAIRADDYDSFRSILEKNSSGIDMLNEDGTLPITEAVKATTLSYVSLLLKHGANINAKDINGKTALMTAVDKIRLAMVQYLVHEGADPEIKDSYGKTAYDYAKELDESPWKEAIKAALFIPRTPADSLYKAIITRDVQQARLWLEARKVDPNERAGPDNEPLVVVALEYQGYQSLRILDLILEHGGDPLAKNRKNKTAFMLAEQSGDRKVLDLMQRYMKIDIN